MTESAHIKIRIDSPAGYVELDRSDRANAYDGPMLDALAAGLQRLAADPQVQVVVITGAQPGRFCAGADLQEIRGRGVDDALNLKSLQAFDDLAAIPKPTIAAVDGPAVGGGMELALACDLRIATERARFFLPETSFGILPAAGGTFRLAQAVGEAMARQMILFGRELDAQQALQCGLVCEVATSQKLDERVGWWVQAAAERDPLALSLAKRALDQWTTTDGGRSFVSSAQAVLYREAKADEE